MAKRKLETAEQERTIRDQPQKTKKHKKSHGALPVVNESGNNKAEVPAANGSKETRKTEIEDGVSEPEIQRRFEKLKQEVKEELQKQNEVGKDEGQVVGGRILMDGTPRRKERKEKRKHKHEEGSHVQIGTGKEVEQAVGKSVMDKSMSKRKEGKRPKKHKHRDKDKQKQKRKHQQDDKKKGIGKQKSQSAWRVSDPIAGHLVDLDTIFSQDEKYFLIAYRASIAVYSTSTSLLVHQLRVKKEEHISGFALEPKNPDRLYVSTISGLIEKWDWVEGSRLGQWKLSSSITILATTGSGERDAGNDLVYTIDRNEGSPSEPWLLSAHRLAGVEDAANTDVATLLKYEKPLSSFQVLEGGRIVLATSETHLILGYCEVPDAPILRDLSYVWRVVECPEWVTSIDVRIWRGSEQEAEKKITCDAVDIAVGGVQGSIYIYEDLLTKLIRKERFPNKARVGDITSRRLHWHRNAVLAIKWSLDGNYVISGGQEDTLVLWQLETGQKQFLPHLGASIESIVVSPTGASYSIRLADNSAMILSTSELKPTFSTTGVQIPSISKQIEGGLPSRPTVNVQKGPIKTPVPACTSSGHLLLAVPASISSRGNLIIAQNSSYLQTFDVGGSYQVSRQALTRTKITTLNMGPESNTIEDPGVTHIQTSHDSQWLATVDVWMPPERDLAPLAFDSERVAEEQTFRQEIYLKFWSWNSDIKVWELVSRIDNPHASSNGNPYDRGRVIGLVSNPATAGFTTVGEDGMVKTWIPAIRRRHGLEVRSKNGNSLRSWHCKHAVSLESTLSLAPLDSTLPKDARSARLAYSQDGSVLAVGIQSVSLSPIYLLDTISGEVRSVQTGLYSGLLFGLGIIDKYLITLADELCVWDLVTDERRWGIQLKIHALPVIRKTSIEPATHLTLDHQNGIFAIAVPESRDESITTRSQIAIFDPMNASPLFATSLRGPATHLLPVGRGKGFYIINPAAEVRTLAPKRSGASLALTLLKHEEAPSRGLSDIFGNGKSAGDAEDGVKKQGRLLASKFDHVTQEPWSHEDGIVVSEDRLAEVFDVGPAYALPPVTELFEQVASLYNGRMR